MSGNGLARRLADILEREAAAGRRNLAETHALALDERVEAGEAVAGLRLLGEKGGVFRLGYDENRSRFRVGDALWLGDGRSIEEGIAVEFVDDDPVERILVVRRDRFRGGGALRGERDLVLDKREIDLTERTVEAIHRVLSESSRGPAHDLLLGRADPGAAVDPVADPEDVARLGLDPYQGEAFLGACRRPFQLVQGPPGTGKTRLAAAIVAAFARAGARVLCAAYTHRAVNNLLGRVAERLVEDGLRDAVPIVKVGRPHQGEGLAALGVEPIAGARSLGRVRAPCVVGVTTHAAVGLLDRRFDLVLVDEAGQVGLPHACAALALGRRHVLVGDHRQLRPLLQAEHPDPLARRSVFEELDRRYGSLLLERTYRMNEALCAFPSRAFYGGRLVPDASVRDRYLELPTARHPALRHEAPGLIVPMEHVGARHVAPREAAFAVDVVSDALRAGLPSDEVAVVAPHRAQGNRIRSGLRERLAGTGHETPVVDTVERLQGGERDLVVLSLTASDPEALLGEARFFFSPHRLNVSLTRARRKLVVLMSERVLDAYPDDPEAFAGAEILRRMWDAYPRLEAAPVTS